MSKLVRWDTPFTEILFPSVGLLISTTSSGSDILNAVVAPHGIDSYPKYLINFGEVIAHTCFEEAHAPKRDFDSAIIEEEDLCAYEYIASPWLKTYEAWAFIYFGDKPGAFYHYLLFGGDSNFEVITPNRPLIETVNEEKILHFEYKL